MMGDLGVARTREVSLGHRMQRRILHRHETSLWVLKSSLSEKTKTNVRRFRRKRSQPGTAVRAVGSAWPCTVPSAPKEGEDGATTVPVSPGLPATLLWLNDSLEGLTELGKLLYPPLWFITPQRYRRKSAKREGAWGRPGETR